MEVMFSILYYIDLHIIYIDIYLLYSITYNSTFLVIIPYVVLFCMYVKYYILLGIITY